MPLPTFQSAPDSGFRHVTLEIPCPRCESGTIILTLTEDRKVLHEADAWYDHEDTLKCMTAYDRGEFTDAIAAAIAHARQAERDHDPSAADLERLTDTAGSSDADTLHSMREARRVK